MSYEEPVGTQTTKVGCLAGEKFDMTFPTYPLACKVDQCTSMFPKLSLVYESMDVMQNAIRLAISFVQSRAQRQNSDPSQQLSATPPVATSSYIYSSFFPCPLSG